MCNGVPSGAMKRTPTSELLTSADGRGSGERLPPYLTAASSSRAALFVPNLPYGGRFSGVGAHSGDPDAACAGRSADATAVSAGTQGRPAPVAPAAWRGRRRRGADESACVSGKPGSLGPGRAGGVGALQHCAERRACVPGHSGPRHEPRSARTVTVKLSQFFFFFSFCSSSPGRNRPRSDGDSVPTHRSGCNARAIVNLASLADMTVCRCRTPARRCDTTDRLPHRTELGFAKA